MNRVLATALALALPALAMAAGVEGKWKTAPSETSGHSLIVEVSQCGDGYCGVTIANTAGTDRFVGMTIVSGMQTSDGINFKNGQITDPEKQKTYKSKMKLVGDVLEVSGCIGPFCRTQSWTRE